MAKRISYIRKESTLVNEVLLTVVPAKSLAMRRTHNLCDCTTHANELARNAIDYLAATWRAYYLKTQGRWSVTWDKAVPISERNDR